MHVIWQCVSSRALGGGGGGGGGVVVVEDQDVVVVEDQDVPMERAPLRQAI